MRVTMAELRALAFVYLVGCAAAYPLGQDDKIVDTPAEAGIADADLLTEASTVVDGDKEFDVLSGSENTVDIDEGGTANKGSREVPLSCQRASAMDGFKWVLFALQYLSALDPPQSVVPTNKPSLNRFGFGRPVVVRESFTPEDYAGLRGVEPRDLDFHGPCDSNIYCYGKLLHTVQMKTPYPDSKTFVDLKIRESPTVAWAAFDKMMRETQDNPSYDDIKQYVDKNFESGNELEVWDPPDWKTSIALLSKIADQPIRDWASGLNELWKTLGRRVRKEVRDNPELYSLIFVPNGFIIPGGRFKELYYWDTYWIVQGLLISEMPETAKGVIENLLWLVEKLGLIPNGSRVYYEQRSQVPLLIPMVSSYFKKTKDYEFVKKNFHLMEKEFNYWMEHATVEVKKDGNTYKLARYFAPSDGPRPESYREDFTTAGRLNTAKEKNELYWDLKSAAASGWDFSTRWFIDANQTNEGNLSDAHTRHIIPVDLNAIIYGNARIMEDIAGILQDHKSAASYGHIADGWLSAVTEVLWDEADGSWYDYDNYNGQPRKYFYASNIVPLWTKCYKAEDKIRITEKVVKYINGTGILKYRGGIPTSLIQSGEQWDFPNCWAPLNIFVIQGLEYTGVPEAQEMSKEFAQRWLHANYIGWNNTHEMFEKYHAINVGQDGSGGEYEVQTGFGWTNGVVLELLEKYGSIPGFILGNSSTTDAPSTGYLNGLIQDR